MKPQIDILKNELLIPSSTDFLADVRNFVEMTGLRIGLEKRTIAHIKLAVDEACTNIIKHAYNGASNKNIKIKIDTSPKKLTVTITDNGKSFDPELVSDPNIEQSQKMKKGGGLGMYLMKNLMDEVNYKTNSSGNKLLLIKNLN